MTNNDEFTFTGTTDENGEITIPYYTESNNNMEITIQKDFYKTATITKGITFNLMTANILETLYGFSNESVIMKVKDNNTGVIIEDANVNVTNNADFTFEGLTDENGAVTIQY